MVIAYDPNAFFERLWPIHNYKLKGVSLPECDLGRNFTHNADGILCLGSKTCIEKLMQSYECNFGSLPCKENKPGANADDHPELDDSAFLDIAGIQLYQSMIGALQWCVTLGRIDIAFRVMIMSHFWIEPREGHLARLKHLYGYLQKRPDDKLRF